MATSFRANPLCLGVDNWAIRKAKTYCTILVDLERHQPIDCLEGRTAEGLRGWLNAHSGVEVVTLDRSGEYARGACEGAPQAQQVADRWHLLQNLFDKPDISLSFFFKHKYYIERNPMAYDVELHLKNSRNELLNKSLTHQLSPT